MKQEDKLRNTLREYYDNQEVPYNDGDWEQASAQLSAIRSKRSTRRLVVIFIALFSVFSTLYMIRFYSPESTGNQKPRLLSLSHQKLQSVSTPQPDLVHPPVTAVKKVNANSKPGNKRYKPSRPLMISAVERNERSFSTSAGLSPENTSQDSPGEVLNTDAQKNDVKEEFASDSDSLIAPAAPANAVTSNIRKEVKPDVPEELTVMNPAQVMTENLTANENPVREKEIPRPVIETLLQPSGTVDVTDSKNEVTTINTAKDSIPYETTFRATREPNSPVPDAPDTAGMEVQDALSGPFDSYDPLGKGFFLEAGATWLYGWKGPQTIDAMGFSPTAGIHYMNRFGNYGGFSIGLAYVMIPNLSASSKTSRVSTYEYGEQSSVMVITPSSLHYLMVPLRLHYVVGHRNSIGAGFNLGYLLNVYSTVTSYNETPGLNTDYKTSKLGGYTEGFSKFDTQAALCYRRRLGKSLALQAEVFLGLSDVKHNDFFGLNYKERNSGAKLSLIYNVFRKNDK